MRDDEWDDWLKRLCEYCSPEAWPHFFKIKADELANLNVERRSVSSIMHEQELLAWHTEREVSLYFDKSWLSEIGIGLGPATKSV